ncbi:MAG: CAP domain-containing protein [Actinomycetota bacterium]
MRSSMIRSASRPLLAAIVACALAGSVSLAGAEPALAATTPRQQMLSLTNQSRSDHGVRRLKLNTRLSKMAARHSRQMAQESSLFHTGNIPGELRHWHWSVWGENVGMTTDTLPTLEDAFMNSPVHRENILNKRFTHVGIGVAHVNGAYWVTVTFYG